MLCNACPPAGPLPQAASAKLPPLLAALISEKGEVLLRGVGTLRYSFYKSSVKTLLVKCPSVQWQPDGLTIHTKKWFLGAGFLGAPPISLIIARRPEAVCAVAGEKPPQACAL